MKHTLKKIFTLSLLISLNISGHCCSDRACALPIKSPDCMSRCYGYPLIAYRSQSLNLPRRMVGTQADIHKYGMDDRYWSSFVALEYTRSFRPERILEQLLGPDVCNCNLMIQGSQVSDRSSRAWMADYFGLPMDFESTICFEPRIQNFIIDFHHYVGLDNWHEGMFARIYAPLVYTRWDLRMCEKVKAKGTTPFPKGYMSTCEVPLTEMASSFTEAMKGCSTFGDMKSPMAYGLFSPCVLTDTRLADLRVEVGTNFALKEDYHFGVALHAAAPTGTRPDARYIFEPMVGNGRHWELGLGVTSSYIFWRSECEDKYAGVYFDAVLTHMFKACQIRSFDLLCKVNSRYMLLEEMGPNNYGISKCDGLCCPCLANYAYTGKLIPAINATTFCVDTKVAVQGDLAIKLAYYSCGWSFDIGYNFWGRTGEEFYLRDGCCNPCGNHQYAIKGDSYLYGKYDLGGTDVTVALSATQSEADIHSGKNYPIQNGDPVATKWDDPSVTYGDAASLNPRIDNPKEAYAWKFPLSNLNRETWPIKDPDAPDLNTSIQPKVLTACDIDMYKSPKAYTHKLFLHVNYKWDDECKDVNPYLGLGGEAEFNGSRCKDVCESPRLGVSQWGIWLKAGWSYE